MLKNTETAKLINKQLEIIHDMKGEKGAIRVDVFESSDSKRGRNKISPTCPHSVVPP